MRPIKALGIASINEDKILDVFYFKTEQSHEESNSYKFLNPNEQTNIEEIANLDLSKNKSLIEVHLVSDEAITDVPTAFLKLFLISNKSYKPNELVLDNIFNTLETLAWTSNGPMEVTAAQKKLLETKISGQPFSIYSVDKFPPLTDYLIPEKVRIADTARIRLGAYLGEGTTIMHAGFVNFNAGSEGPNMVEGRISSKVFVAKGSDLGGGSSTMGTLSGGNDQVISIGENSLVGANAGVGISLGNNCTVEAGLYITSGTKITVMDDKNEEQRTVKAIELSGLNNILFFRDSLTGKVMAKPNNKEFSLNEILHNN